MKQAATYRQLLGIALFAVWVAAFGFRSAHHLFAHLADRHPVCEETYARDGSAHIHDERYQPDDCSLCAFLFAVPVLADLPILPQAKAPFAYNIVCPTTTLVVPQSGDFTYRRGPPAGRVF